MDNASNNDTFMGTVEHVLTQHGLGAAVLNDV